MRFSWCEHLRILSVQLLYASELCIASVRLLSHSSQLTDLVFETSNYESKMFVISTKFRIYFPPRSRSSAPLQDAWRTWYRPVYWLSTTFDSSSWTNAWVTCQKISSRDDCPRNKLTDAKYRSPWWSYANHIFRMVFCRPVTPIWSTVCTRRFLKSPTMVNDCRWSSARQPYIRSTSRKWPYVVRSFIQTRDRNTILPCHFNIPCPLYFFIKINSSDIQVNPNITNPRRDELLVILVFCSCCVPSTSTMEPGTQKRFRSNAVR